MSKLSELLNVRNTKNLTYREIGRRAIKNGHEISQASATAIMGGRHGVVSDDLLEAIASVLPVTIEEMRTALDLPPDPGTPWEPPEAAKRLTLPQRAALDQLIKTIVRDEGGSDAGDAEAEKTPDDPSGGGATVTPITGAKGTGRYLPADRFGGGVGPTRLDETEVGGVSADFFIPPPLRKPEPEPEPEMIEVKEIQRPTPPARPQAARRITRKTREAFDAEHGTDGEERQDGKDTTE